VEVRNSGDGSPATVLLSTYLGSKNQLVLKTSDGTEVKAWSSGYFPEGSDVVFSVPKERILTYPA
jgi:hypothetical protein